MKAVLIIHSSEQTRDKLASLLNALGVDLINEASLASSGLETLKTFGPETYGIIFVGESFPDMETTELIREIRKVEGTIPIVARVSSHAQADPLFQAGASLCAIGDLGFAWIESLKNRGLLSEVLEK